MAPASRAYAERRTDLGEVVLNWAVAGAANRPALLLIPGQAECWWAYEAAMARLASAFHVHAVDLRGQGGSTWTPGRYTLDNLGNDLVRFIDRVIGRPTVVSGSSSGGLVAAWLSAWALPGQVRGAHCSDAPFFTAEVEPLHGPSIRGSAGPIFELYSRHLGDQWQVGDWTGMVAAAAAHAAPAVRLLRFPPRPPEQLRTYDPEWGRAFLEGEFTRSCPHHRMLAGVKTPLLFSHHQRRIDPATGMLIGAVTDGQVAAVRALVTGAGQAFDLLDLPDAAHSLHRSDPDRFATLLSCWAAGLPE